MVRFEENLSKINSYSSKGEGINRLAFTEQDVEAKKYLIKKFKDEGLLITVDSVGNIIAKREGKDNGLPSISMGSHIDTVYEGGKYDGTIGVIGAFEIIQYFNENNIQTLHPLEIIVFSAEESSRFGVATLGSGFMAGNIRDEDVKDLKDKDGQTLNEVLLKNGMDLKEYRQSIRSKDELKAFIELHIEQGPILEEEDIDIGIVEAIAAPLRLNIKVTGKASHSGTTPVNYRRDALLGASELNLFIERIAKEEEKYGSVATVGMLDVKPGGMNIVPGLVNLYVDIRSVSDSSKERIFDAIQRETEKISSNRNLMFEIGVITNQKSVSLSKELTSNIKKLCKHKNITYKSMNSGAGHDAMHMSSLCPTALIFVPSKDGISHNPNEFTKIEDIQKGLVVMKELILSLDEEVDENESE